MVEDESFEQQFPELKNKRMLSDEPIIVQSISGRMFFAKDKRIFYAEDIKSFCLSRQRVKEAIEKIYNSNYSCSLEKRYFADKLLQELGLDG